MDPERLRIDGRKPASRKKSAGKVPRHKRGEKFLLGPIPWDWLCAAASASGRGSALKVAIALWHQAGLNRQASTVKLSTTVLRGLGVGRHSAYRGLADLERARLVTVDRQAGRSPVVTILGAGVED